MGLGWYAVLDSAEPTNHYPGTQHYGNGRDRLEKCQYKGCDASPGVTLYLVTHAPTARGQRPRTICRDGLYGPCRMPDHPALLGTAVFQHVVVSGSRLYPVRRGA